jgi:hypothetical protein
MLAAFPDGVFVRAGARRYPITCCHEENRTRKGISTVPDPMPRRGLTSTAIALSDTRIEKRLKPRPHILKK